jgi:hypothetical protein
MWGYVKNIVYAEKIHDLDHLRQKIITAVATITPDMLHVPGQKQSTAWMFVELQILVTLRPIKV